MVLVRCYGHKSDLLIDRQAEIRNMKLLNEGGCGSELYASFKNGICYEFLRGTTLTSDTVFNPDIYPLVARAMANLHKIKIEAWKIAKTVDCFSNHYYSSLQVFFC